MPQPATGRARLEDFSPEQRLNGWKEIAAYLDRGERTVKRWESDRGLPIHRIPGGGRAAVHAFKPELDDWLQSVRAAELDRSEPQDEIPAAVPLLNPLPPESLASPAFSEPSTVGPSRQAKSVIVTGVFLLAALALLIAFSLYSSRHRAARATSGQVSEAEKVIASDLYLRGRFEWNKRTPESLNRALEDFNQSIVHDPTSARTYSGLADTYILLREYALMPESEAYTRAIAAATKAVELDDSLAEAHRSLAFAEVWGRLDFRSAQKEFRRAIALNPRDPLTHLWYATAFKAPSWYAVTSREFALAQELDPSSAVILTNKSIWLFETGQQQAGIDLAHQVERAEPDFPAPHRYLAAMYWFRRDYSDFLIESEKAADLVHDPVLKRTTDAARAGFQKNGEHGLLNALYLARKTEYEAGRLPGSSLAEVCVHLERQDEALQVLQYDFDHHLSGLPAILTNPDLRTMASDPQYQRLIDRLNYPDPPSIDQ
jgi:tetratricopeptide (TPR) repeat protein